jgi:serine protease AprX
MRRSVAIVFLVLVLLQPAASNAAPERAATRSADSSIDALLADLDADGLSDAFEARLRRLASSARVSVVVTFDGPGGVATARDAVGSFVVTRRFDLVRGFAATMTKAQAQDLAAQPGVFRVEQDVRVRAFLDSADADFGTERARADFGVTGAGVEVCIVDTGVDPNHEQLDGKAPIAFFDAVAGLAIAYDDNGHGTHVAGIAVGDSTGGADAPRYGGVAPGAALSAAKVLNAAGSGSMAQVMAGIDWCAARPSVRVISMSLGTSAASDGNDGISRSVNSAVAAGKVVVVAAGNSGDDPRTVGSPGAATGAITVGAVAEHSAPPGAANHSDGIYLADFSSRGPTLDGRIKPDIASPGVSITSADAGTTGGYVTFSGTSMATPFISGTVALALQASPSWGPAEVRTALEGSAADRGAPGKDNEYGAGLVDGHAFVATAAGMTGGTTFPTWSGFSAGVADHGLWSHAFEIAPADLGVPIAATIIIDGAPVCVASFFGLCLDYDWGPDLEARLIDPNGVQLDLSTCPIGDECGNGRQETVHAMPTVAGSYRLEVFPTEDAPHNGRGGTFRVDLSTGPIGGTPPPPPPPPPPPQPKIVHVGDLDGSATPSTHSRWRAAVVITVHDVTDAPRSGVTVRGSWDGGSTVSCVTNSAGTCSITKLFSNSKTRTTFAVTRLSLSGYTYDAVSNHDPDGDSTGTSIVVLRP